MPYGGPAPHAALPPQDLERAAVEYAEAAFIMCDKYAPDAAHEDRRHSLMLLSVGQYLAVRGDAGSGVCVLSECLVALNQRSKLWWRACTAPSG